MASGQRAEIHGSFVKRNIGIRLTKRGALWTSLISFKTDKETFARCLIISGHGNSSLSGKFYPSSFVSIGVK